MTAREECTCIKLPGGGRLPMDDCPVHSKGGDQNNERKAPDVAEPRSELLHHFRIGSNYCERCGIHVMSPSTDDPCVDTVRSAPGPSVHHDETHGYHTADGEPVGAVMAELREYVKLSRGYDGVPRTVLVNAIAEIERLEGERDGACHHINLQIKRAEKAEAENAKLRETLERLDDELSEPLWLDVALPRLRKMIANALAAKSLEESLKSNRSTLNTDKV